MPDLGSWDTGQLAQLVVALLGCAGVTFVFIVIYLFLARRSRKRRLGLGQETQPRPSSSLDTTTVEQVIGSDQVSGAVPSESAGLPSLDVEARLAGTGRDAWFQGDVISPPLQTWAGGYEVFRVVWYQVGQSTWVKVAGASYSKIGGIRDQVVGQRMLQAICYCLRFSSGLVLTDQGPTRINLPPSDRVPLPTGFGALSGPEEPGEIMRLVCDEANGKIWVQVGGQRHSRLTDVADHETGYQILLGITRLLQFSGGRLASDEGISKVPVPELDSEIGPPATSSEHTMEEPSPKVTTSSQVSPEEEEKFLQSLMNPEPPQTPGRSGPVGKTATGTSPTFFSLAEEINRIFQRKLTAAGAAGIDAEIVERADGTIAFRIEGKHYSFPEQIPNQELARLARLAVDEW